MKGIFILISRAIICCDNNEKKVTSSLEYRRARAVTKKKHLQIRKFRDAKWWDNSARYRDNKGPFCLPGLAVRGASHHVALSTAGICDIKLFNHRTIEKARVPTVARRRSRVSCA